MYFLVDTHVHIYPQYNLPLLLNTALENFSRCCLSLSQDKYLKNKLAISSSNENEIRKVLLLTETVNDNAFAMLKQMAADGKAVDDWSFKSVSESIVQAIKGDEESSSILIVAGQQVISAEKLEVSLWHSDEKSFESLKATDIIEKALASGASVALPWGVAKWWGRRGQLVLDLMNEFGNKIYLTDNSGRPIFWTKPQHFKLAKKKDIAVFAGSDVLPVDSGESKVARYISVFQSDEALLNQQSLQKILNSPNGNVGRLASPIEFFKDQLAMQQRKHSK